MNEDFEFGPASDHQFLAGEEYDSLREELLAEMWQDAYGLYEDVSPDYDYDYCGDDYDAGYDY